MNTEQVKKLLYKHDYITVVQKSGDGCIITYPHPKLLNDTPRLVEMFKFQRGREVEKQGFLVSTSYDKDDAPEKFFKVPEYALRLYVVCEISACNAGIPIHPSMMVFLDENEAEQEEIENIITPPASQEDANKEGFLYRLIIEAMNDGFPPTFEEVAKTHGVHEGYTLLRKFYN